MYVEVTASYRAPYACEIIVFEKLILVFVFLRPVLAGYSQWFVREVLYELNCKNSAVTRADTFRCCVRFDQVAPDYDRNASRV